MLKDLNRRSFIKGALAAAGAAAATGVPLPRVVKGSQGGELATMLDLSKCIGCEACVEACQDVNAKYKPEPVKPIPKMYPKRVPIEDWSDRRDVTDRLTPYNWLYVQRAEVKIDGEETEVFIPRRCMHCQNPPCADLCPFGAARKMDNGITNIDPDICLGGAKCRQVCPWNIPQRQSGVGIYLDIATSLAGNGVMYKCHRCYERIGEGRLPACIEICPEKVQTIGPREEIVAKAHARAKEINGYIYGENENGGTNTIYVSPVPFSELNKAIEKGKGKPHLGPVANSMAQAENLTAALVLAPLAGAALALGKIRKLMKDPAADRKNKEDRANE
ncbi:MAG: 4Fe-4S dicluster domain-containing protein [Proteobacteria bacterium]|nr:4Fe-4S dicluster domain-containing protein [Pseudomonadota bacterium]